MSRKIIPFAAGCLAMVQAQVAQAQEACVAPADLDDTITYAMPLAYDAALNACEGRFAPDGFMATGGAEFVDGFRDRQDAAWPGTFRLLKVFMSTPPSDGSAGTEEMVALLSSLPEDSIRPFVDAIIVQQIIPEIKPDSCADIERGLELVSPLPPENVSALFTFIAEQTDLENPPICKATDNLSGR